MILEKTIMNVKKFRISRRLEKIIIAILLILTIQYVSFYYISIGVFPRFLLYFFYLAALLFVILLSQSVKIKTNLYQKSMMMVFLMMLIESMFNYSDHFGEWLNCFVIYLPIITALYFRKFPIEFLLKIFKVISIVALILLPYALTVQNVKLDAALDRDYAWTESFFFAPLFWAVIPAVILSFLTKKYVILSIFYWMGAVILNLLFLKRFIIVDSLLLVFIILCINSMYRRKLIKSSKLIFIGICTIGVLLYLKGDFIIDLFDATTSRIETTSEDISAFDRFVESENYLSVASFSEILIGKGFAGTHHGLGETATALHVGWVNFVLKGGVVLLILIMFPYFKLIKITPNLKKYPIKIQFSYWFLLIYSVRLFYINMHNMSPEMLIFFYSLYNIMQFPLVNQKKLSFKRV